MGYGGWGEGGGLPSKKWTSTRVSEFKFKKMVKIHKNRPMANAQYVSLSDSIILTFSQLRPVITSIFEGEGKG